MPTLIPPIGLAVAESVTSPVSCTAQHGRRFPCSLSLSPALILFACLFVVVIVRSYSSSDSDHKIECQQQERAVEGGDSFADGSPSRVCPVPTNREEIIMLPCVCESLDFQPA